MKKYITGIIIGTIAGVINCLFLFFANDLETPVFVSIFFMWIVIGLLIHAVNFKMNGLLKGIVVSLLVSISSLIYTFSSTVFGGIFTLMTTVLVGAFMGYLIDKVNVG